MDIERIIIVVGSLILFVLILGALLYYLYLEKNKSAKQEVVSKFLFNLGVSYVESVRYIDYIEADWVIKNNAIWDFETGEIIVCHNIQYTLDNDEQRKVVTTLFPGKSKSNFKKSRIISLRKSDKKEK